MSALENIVIEAMLLPQDQRLTLALRILSSVEPGSIPDESWDDEICARIDRYDAGQTLAIPGNVVFQELDKKLNG